MYLNRPLFLLLFAAWLVIGRSEVGYGQGFGVQSGRNHPELDWRVAETDHFRIMYPRHLEGIEIEAAPIAEVSYEVLATNLQVTFDRKIDIYLSDEDEIVNGFAVPIGNGHTNIWVHVPEFARTKTGPDKWLRAVIAHELAHIFHYRKVLDRPRWTAFLLGDPLPRFWTEGIAQYQTEEWSAMRGDRWLRTAVLEDRLSYADGRSVWNGRLLYAVGHSQVRYLADRYGDSTIVDILAHRRPALFGLAAVHDFGAAFRAVTGSSYRSFYDEWRRHVNVYYNTLAAGLENVDSLGTDPLNLPGQYFSDVAFAPDTSRAAVLSLTSLDHPVRRLWVVDRERDRVSAVAEGSIQPPVAWSPDGRRIAYSSIHRGRHGSLIRDLYVVDAAGSNRRQLTHDRRAGSPAFSPDGERLAFAAAGRGTENIHVMHLATQTVSPVTDFDGDVQVSSLQWHPGGGEILFDRFRADGRRDIAVVDLASNRIDALTPGAHDDRSPVYSPTGDAVAYTSLRDHVPNVFVLDRGSGRHERVTNLATGAEVLDWLPADSLHSEGSLIISSSVSKSEDRVFRIDAARRAPESMLAPPEPFASWTTHHPPVNIPYIVEPDTTFVTDRYRYRSLRNLRHVATMAFPYVRSARATDRQVDWGAAGFTSWIEPLGKHAFFAVASLSLTDPRRGSYAAVSYLNNQWHPTIGVNLYRMPGSAQAYGNDLLVEGFTGGDLSLTWPLDWFDRPYASHTFSARIRVVEIEALAPRHFEGGGVLPPEEGRQADLRLSLTWRKQRPYWNNVIHPLDGLGARLQVMGAARVLGTDTQFVRADAAAFGIFPGLGRHRLFLYGRGQVQSGAPFAQHFVGLSRHDAVQIDLPNQVPLLFGEAERVRGYRTYALGDRMAFGTMEYRLPLVSDLRTRLLGLASLGSLAGALFVDGAVVGNAADDVSAVRRVGVGIELKNALRLGGSLRVAHAVGIAQPARAFGNRSRYEIYYRIRTTVPF